MKWSDGCTCISNESLFLQERVKAIEKNLPSALQDYELAGCNAPRQFFSWPGEGGWR
jgi:hypothetical protein